MTLKVNDILSLRLYLTVILITQKSSRILLLWTFDIDDSMGLGLHPSQTNVCVLGHGFRRLLCDLGAAFAVGAVLERRGWDEVRLGVWGALYLESSLWLDGELAFLDHIEGSLGRCVADGVVGLHPITIRQLLKSQILLPLLLALQRLLLFQPLLPLPRYFTQF